MPLTLEMSLFMSQSSRNQRFTRFFLAFVLAITTLYYTISVVAGEIPKDQQLSATHLALLAFVAIAVILLIAPESISRLKLLELSGFKLELLERVREKQAEQAQELDAIRLVLPLLLPETERAHLVNLSENRTKGYRGGYALRTELRRLRSVDLIQMTGKGYVEELKGNKSFDLADYVKLTDLGEQWAIHIAKIEDRKDKNDSPSSTSTEN